MELLHTLKHCKPGKLAEFTNHAIHPPRIGQNILDSIRGLRDTYLRRTRCRLGCNIGCSPHCSLDRFSSHSLLRSIQRRRRELRKRIQHRLLFGPSSSFCTDYISPIQCLCTSSHPKRGKLGFLVLQGFKQFVMLLLQTSTSVCSLDCFYLLTQTIHRLIFVCHSNRANLPCDFKLPRNVVSALGSKIPLACLLHSGSLHFGDSKKELKNSAPENIGDPYWT